VEKVGWKLKALGKQQTPKEYASNTSSLPTKVSGRRLSKAPLK